MSIDRTVNESLVGDTIPELFPPAPAGSAKIVLAAAGSAVRGKTVAGYYGWFDPLRAVLALAVFISHVGIIPAGHHLGGMGASAVQVFFALSGFLVGGILLRKAQQPAPFWTEIPRFYFNRCLRIWAPYYLMILAFLVLMATRGLLTWEGLDRLVPALTYTHNWANFQGGVSALLAPINHMWSLGVEEQFYLFCPLLAGFIRDRRAVIALMLLLALAVPILSGAHFYTCIALGVAAAALHQLVPAHIWHQIQRVGLYLGIPLFLVLVLIGHQSHSLPMAVAALLVVVGCSRSAPPNRFTLLLGAMSYSFYLFHWLGIYLANPVAKRLPDAVAQPAFVLLALSVSVLISYASVTMIERPLMQRRDALVQRHPWLPSAATVAAFGITLFGLWWILAL